MAVTIKIRTGVQADVAAASAQTGEPLFATDSGELYIYDGSDKVLIGPTSATHTLLDGGTVHTDTAADTVTRGSIIIGNSTPAWDELVVGSAGTVLTSDGTDVSWQTPSSSGGADVAWFLM